MDFTVTLADNSSSLGSKLIFSNAPTYDFYLRELLKSELTYLLTAHFYCAILFWQIRLSVCLSVRHTMVLYLNERTYRQTLFTAW